MWGVGLDRVRWVGMGWGVMRRDGMGWDRVGCHRSVVWCGVVLGWDGVGRVVLGWDGMGWEGWDG